jgi:hypothetical protein
LTFHEHIRRMVPGRSRAVSRPLALAGVAALALAPLSIAAPAGAAAAAPAPAFSLFAPSATFHVGGHTWSMAFFYFSGSAEINLSTGNESDGWGFFGVPTSDLTANATTGAATFNAHSSLAPIASAKLKFDPGSRRKASCVTGSETFIDGKITGSISLAANKSLTFKSAHVVFKGSLLGIDRNCVSPSGPTVCFAGAWGNGASENPTTISGDTPGLPGQRKYSVSVFKTVLLSTPANSSVTYEVTGSENKPVFDSKQRQLSVKTTGVVKGSAVIKASRPPTVTTSSCTIGHTHYKARDANYFGSWASPAGFSARSIIGGLLKVARTSPASFSIITFKRT